MQAGCHTILGFPFISSFYYFNAFFETHKHVQKVHIHVLYILYIDIHIRIYVFIYIHIFIMYFTTIYHLLFGVSCVQITTLIYQSLFCKNQNH